jgi:integrase
MLKERNVRTGFFEREQIDRILTHLPPAIRPAVQFGYITGWRIPSEVLRLQWRHVDFEARVVRLDPHTTKNDEGRTFPFTDALQRLLETQKAEHERLKAEGIICPWVFNRSNQKVKGKRITTFIKAFRAACTKAGCPGRIPHDLRRTAVRNLVRAGVPERVAMQMTGHKTRSVFERYNIVSECDLVEAAKKLNALQPAALPPEGGSHMSDRDGLASTKPRPVRHSAKRDGGSGEVGHNSGTMEPDRGPRLTVSL